MEPYYYKGLDVQFYVSLPDSSPAFQLHNYATKELGMSLGIRHFLHLKPKLSSLVVPQQRKGLHGRVCN